MEFGRYSDDLDKETNDRVAVLEFELRKSLETIKSLRGSLTQATGEGGHMTCSYVKWEVVQCTVSA